MAMARTKNEKAAGESKEERFTRLAQTRTDNALRSIRILGNLSNISNYAYTPEQVQKIFAALRAQLDNAEGKFDAGTRKTLSEKFKF